MSSSTIAGSWCCSLGFSLNRTSDLFKLMMRPHLYAGSGTSRLLPEHLLGCAHSERYHRQTGDHGLLAYLWFAVMICVLKNQPSILTYSHKNPCT